MQVFSSSLALAYGRFCSSSRHPCLIATLTMDALSSIRIRVCNVDCFKGRLIMIDGPNLARLGGLIADPARAHILWMLMDGSLRPAGELARSADVSAQSA